MIQCSFLTSDGIVFIAKKCFKNKVFKAGILIASSQETLYDYLDRNGYFSILPNTVFNLNKDKTVSCITTNFCYHFETLNSFVEWLQLNNFKEFTME